MKKILQQLLVLLMFYSVFLIWPLQANSMLPILVYLMLGLSVLWLPIKHHLKYKRGGITKGQAWAGFGWDFLKIFVVILLASLLGRMGAVYASGLAESYWQGMGALAGFIALLVISLIVANGVGWGIQKLGKL